jgi:hypothetical protein
MLCSSEILSPEPSQVHGIGCTERNNCPYDYYVIRFHEKNSGFWWIYSLENHSFLDVSARKCLAESVSGGLSLKKSAHMTDG